MHSRWILGKSFNSYIKGIIKRWWITTQRIQKTVNNNMCGIADQINVAIAQLHKPRRIYISRILLSNWLNGVWYICK